MMNPSPQTLAIPFRLKTLTALATFIAWVLALSGPGINAQVTFTPTTLPCGITTVNVEYTACPDWSGVAGISRPGSPPGVLLPNGGGVVITNGTGSFQIEVLSTAPDSFE